MQTLRSSGSTDFVQMDNIVLDNRAGKERVFGRYRHSEKTVDLDRSSADNELSPSLSSTFSSSASLQFIGTIRSRTAELFQLRRPKIADSSLETARLENRFDKISKLSRLELGSNERKELEKRIVQWESDSESVECCVCRARFWKLQRKHHCRLCGKIMCGNGACCRMMKLNLDNNCSIRVCSFCDSTLLLRFQEEDLFKPFLALYSSLRKQRQIVGDETLQFNQLLESMESMLAVSGAECMKMTGRAESSREYIANLFIRYEMSLKSIENLVSRVPESQPQMIRLLRYISRENRQYLQLNMMGLRCVPRDLFRRRMHSSPGMESSQDSAQHTGRLKKRISEFIRNPPFRLSFLASSPEKIEPLDPEYRSILIDQRINLDMSLNEAVDSGQDDSVTILQNAIEDIDSLLRREYEQ